ncbi:O-methyltransferase [Caulobacter sp. 17J80-11]|uniref:O-methyltransferase n=1 Tax=Caulobacter sp. 17J80-11 TaxID=2763502 RepID=UPI001653571D|nr:class I SAM-dependent methyltransferase [Caulobacter sp. 17J80-11]MBC6981516.1 class I SAM-dependent methyltransferase [Caulobacter sp. 17J80-11]
MSRSLGLSDEVRAYVQRLGVREDPVLARCRAETEAMGGVSRMQISPEQGGFMQVVARMIRARRAIEVGVFTGYSSTATALALKAMHGEGARLFALDLSEEYVARARGYWAEAKVADVIEARLGPAADSLRGLLAEGEAGGFDMAFIDADKTGYGDYYELCLQLLRPGGVMMIDNMLWGGDVAYETKRDPDTEALRTLAGEIHDDPRVDMTLATIGDGLSIVVKR